MFLVFDGSNVLMRAYGVAKVNGGDCVAIALGIIMSAIRKYKPTHVAYVLDPKGGTFRNEEYPEYKSTRERDPVKDKEVSALRKQLKQELADRGIKVIVKKGFEADDVIGAITVKAEKAGMQSIIVSNDKDMAQLLTKNVSLLRKAGPEYVMITADNCESIFGAKPKRIVCMLMLLGDDIDCIPGVDGIGPVAAGKLLATCKKIEKADTSIVSKRQQQAYADHKPMFKMTRNLLTIRTDCTKVKVSSYSYASPVPSAGFGML